MKEYATTDGAALPASDEFLSLALDAVVPSLTNPRKHFDPAKLAELAESIKASGVHQPILVRPLPGSRVQETSKEAHRGQKYQGYVVPTHELVAGERRLRAAKLAGLATVPALVRNLTDEQVLEIQLIENLQRTDLTELEEAEGYQQLMESSGITADAVGVKIGKSRSYVFGRLKLLDLCIEARTSLRDGSIDASRALLVARIPDHKLQIKAMKEIVTGGDSWGGDREPMTYREASRHVRDDYMLKLDSARFKITDATLVPAAGSCRDCPKRTGANPDLFSDVKGADVCIDPPCFHKKEEAHAAALVKEAKAKGQTVIAGKEAQELMTNGYQPKFKGYKRLDVAEDGPSGQPLRKIIGKQMQTEGINPVMIEHPQKKGELVAALPNEVVLRLLKTVEGQAQTAKTVAKEVRAFADDKKAVAKAKATLKYEQDWRNQLLASTWEVLKDSVPGFTFTLDVHRYLAIRAVSNLSSDDSAALCNLLGLGKIATGSALVEHVKNATNPDALHMLMMMQRDSGADERSYRTHNGVHMANEALHLVAGIVFKDNLDEVTKDVKKASLARFFPKVEKAPVPLASAAQAKGGGGEAKSQKPERPLRKCKLTPADAQAAIAAAMQGSDTNPGAATASQGDKASPVPVSGYALPVGAPLVDAAPLYVARLVQVTSDLDLLRNIKQHKYAGKRGTITSQLGDRAWIVTFGGRTGGVSSFDSSELEAVA